MKRITDLPIDINAIGRQDSTAAPVTRFGTSLFTEDSVQINNALAQQVRHRQETSAQLFDIVSAEYVIEPLEQIADSAGRLALFSTPTDFSHINAPAQETPISIWVIVLVLAVCAVGGFILAVALRAKKKEQTKDVY